MSAAYSTIVGPEDFADRVTSLISQLHVLTGFCDEERIAKLQRSWVLRFCDLLDTDEWPVGIRRHARAIVRRRYRSLRKVTNALHRIERQAIHCSVMLFTKVIHEVLVAQPAELKRMTGTFWAMTKRSAK